VFGGYRVVARGRPAGRPDRHCAADTRRKRPETKRMVTRNDAFKTGKRGSLAASLFHRCQLRNSGSSVRDLCNCAHCIVARLALEVARGARTGGQHTSGSTL